MLRTLREPRYAAFGALMIVVALGCIAAGTWQIFRYEQKRQENQELRRNAHAVTAPVSTVLPLVGAGAAPGRFDVGLRKVQVTGRFDPTQATLVRNRSVGDTTGFFVLTPLRTTDDRIVLVVRGFVPQPSSGSIPRPAAPPVGAVTVTGYAQPAETKDDGAAALPDRQVESINPAQQAKRLDRPVYDGYVVLHSRQPGTTGLQAVPAPGLGNPAGGALEPQHFAYVIQWYLFAALALAAPVVMARAETKQRPSGEIDTVDTSHTVDALDSADTLDPADARAAKLADRYGRTTRR